MNCGYEIKSSYDPRSYGRNFCNCVKKLENFRTSTGFEPVTSRYRCDALTNWVMKPLNLGAGHLWVLMFPWGMNQRWNDIWNGSYMNCRYEIKWSYGPAVHIWSISYIISSLIHSSREHWNPQMTSSQRQWLHSLVGYFVSPVSLLYAIAKIASITARIIASLNLKLVWNGCTLSKPGMRLTNVFAFGVKKITWKIP